MINDFFLRMFAGFFLVVGVFSGCVSGPVTTQIDITKNPVVRSPQQFQSPHQAIDSFLEASNRKSSKDRIVRQVWNNSLKTLINQQLSVASELSTTGKLRLKPGFSYELDLETFCVNAGVERPVKGDGLFVGDIQGAAKSWLPVVLRDYKTKGISQSDAQILIWSLLSRSRFDQLSIQNQSNLLKIFPDAYVRFGNSIVESQAADFFLSQVPSELLSAKEQIEKYQEILQDSKLKFSEIEQVLSPASSKVQADEVGWLKHEDGYYIHLQASGYQQVHVKIYAPEDAKEGTYFEPTKSVALPGQGQRLALSANVIDHKKSKANQFIKDKTGVSTNEALFILKHPIDAFQIYQAAQKAIETTWSHLKSSHNYEDDNTDAFRHFVWSGLMTHEIGHERAKEYLDAHEDFPENNPAAKAMDLFNNEKGIKYSINYDGEQFEDDLIQEGLRKIGNHELRWIK